MFSGRRGDAGRGGSAQAFNAKDLKALPLQPSLKTIPEAPVTLFHYESGDMDICGGRIGNEARFCVKTRALCKYRHKPKLKLAAGFYIKAPSGRRGLEAAFVNPHVTIEQAQACRSFEHLYHAKLPFPQMDRLLQSVIDGSLEEGRGGEGRGGVNPQRQPQGQPPR